MGCRRLVGMLARLGGILASMRNSFTEIASGLPAIAVSFYVRGWANGTSGNLSAVVEREPLLLAITPSGVDKGALSTGQILIIDEQGRVVSDHGDRPSDETPLHLAIVKERNAGAVFHTHSVWSTILSDLHADEGGLAIEGYEMLKGLEGIKTHEHREWLPILENSQNMIALADRVNNTLRQRPHAHGFLLRRHGLYCWGRDLAQAKRHVEVFEFLLEAVGQGLLIRKR